MTEDEAKAKWCPHAVASHTDPRSGFGGHGGTKIHACIGSECMAWRWMPRRILRSFTDNTTMPFTPGQSYDGSKWFSDEVPGESDGYCGSFGRP